MDIWLFFACDTCTEATQKIHFQYYHCASQFKYINEQIKPTELEWMCFYPEHKNSCMYLSGLIVKFSGLHQTFSKSEETQKVFITWTKHCISNKEIRIDRKNRTWQHYFWFSVSYINISSFSISHLPVTFNLNNMLRKQMV